MATNVFNSYSEYNVQQAVPGNVPWAKGISDSFLKFGWARTSDTGQVDWPTNPPVPPAGEIEKPLGYEIWAMTDPFQTTCPCFIKVEYCIQWQSNYYSRSMIYLTIGTGTDGKGNLTGTVGTREKMFTDAQGGIYWANSYLSGDTCSLTAAIWLRPDSGMNQWFFSIERLRNPAGEVTDAGVLFTVFYARSPFPISTVILKNGKIQRRYIPSPYSPPTFSLTDSNLIVRPIPWQAWGPEGMIAQSSGSVYHYLALDLPCRLNSINMKTNGVSHKYLPLAYSTGNIFTDGAFTSIKLNNICSSFLMRWE